MCVCVCGCVKLTHALRSIAPLITSRTAIVGLTWRPIRLINIYCMTPRNTKKKNHKNHFQIEPKVICYLLTKTNSCHSADGFVCFMQLYLKWTNKSWKEIIRKWINIRNNLVCVVWLSLAMFLCDRCPTEQHSIAVSQLCMDKASLLTRSMLCVRVCVRVCVHVCTIISDSYISCSWWNASSIFQ